MSTIEQRIEALALEQLKFAAREYARAASPDGENLSVLMSGARLRIAAKRWVEAERDAAMMAGASAIAR